MLSIEILTMMMIINKEKIMKKRNLNVYLIIWNQELLQDMILIISDIWFNYFISLISPLNLRIWGLK